MDQGNFVELFNISRHTEVSVEVKRQNTIQKQSLVDVINLVIS